MCIKTCVNRNCRKRATARLLQTRLLEFEIITYKVRHITNRESGLDIKQLQSNKSTFETSTFTSNQDYFWFLCWMSHVSQAIRTCGLFILRNSLRDTEFLNSSKAVKYRSEGTGTPSASKISIASSTSSCSRVRCRSRELLRAAMLSEILPKISQHFFLGLSTTWSPRALFEPEW